MIRPRAILIFALLIGAFPWRVEAQLQPEWDVVSGEGEYSFQTGLATFTNNVILKYGNAVLTADRAEVNQKTGEAKADGHVRIQQDDEIWVGEHVQYNFMTHQMEAEQFRTGKSPVFAAGEGLRGDMTNNVYNATNAFITTDDVANPAVRIRAKHIRIIPGKRIVATGATLYFGDVPVFYFPYYSRNLGPYANNFNFVPGYRSSYGPFLLSSYRWFLNDQLDGEIHLDYRQKRGVGVGPDFNFHLGRWGDGSFRYYYAHDEDPQTNEVLNAPVLENRQRLYFAYQANPFTNFNFKSLVRYQNDIGVLHDFFPGEYRENPQPDTFVEANKFWNNFSLDVLTRPRINDFYETVERLPDVRLTGFRQQLGHSPIYYQSESSAGYYERLFAETNGFTDTNYYAARADTFHQLLLPETFFGWLNVTPRVGGRLTYYSQANGPGATTDEHYRGVFNTGAEVSFKASRLWPGIRSGTLEMDGLRHIIEPSVNYVYVPTPNYRPDQVPQFDYVMPTLRLLPIEYPEYNAIDSIDSENVLRFGLRNKLQTKRKGQVVDLVNWEVLTDWRLDPRHDQRTFADLYSDLSFQPRSWLNFQSQTRLDINDGEWRMLLHMVTFEPNDSWSWSFGHFYLRDDFGAPPAYGQGNNLILSSFFYRLNENWGLRATHHYDIRSGRMQEQYYTVYRDMRSWTAALSAGLRDDGTHSDDFILAFTFSLKAAPKYGLGSDTVNHYSLLGER